MPATARLIAARLNDGASEADLLMVVEDRWQRWGDSGTMADNFKPSTLFKDQKFQEYLAIAKANGNEDSTPKDFKDLGNGWVEVDGTKIQRTRYEREQRQQNTVR